MQWTNLPREIQLNIIEHMQRDECKGFRLTNKAHAQLAAPKLFRTVHLTPNTRSFDRARGIASSPSLSPHVKNVVFHVGVLEDVHSGFQTFRDDIMRLHKPIGNVEEITKDILWKYHCFLEEIEGQQDFEARDEFEELESLCQSFETLQSLTTVLDEDDPFSPPVDFIGQRTGVQSACSADGSHFSNLFNASAGKSLTALNGWSMSWHCLPYVVNGALETMNFQLFRDLSLGLYNSEYLGLEPSDKTAVLEALDVFLGATMTSNNFSLQLDFDEIPFEMVSSQLREISLVVFKHHWPSLVSLSLQGIVSTEAEILDFLSKHSASLKKLHLDDIELVDEISYDIDGDEVAMPGSVLSLFHQINQDLRLELASISGNFTNRLDESWYVNLELDHDHDNCLRHDIELWLSRKSPPPFPKELITSKKRKTREKHTKNSLTHDLLTHSAEYPMPYAASGFADGSWIWDPELGDLSA